MLTVNAVPDSTTHNRERCDPCNLSVVKMSNVSPFDKPTIQSRLSVRGTKWHRDAPDIIPLWLADPDYPLCPELKDEMRKVIESEMTEPTNTTEKLFLTYIAKQIDIEASK